MGKDAKKLHQSAAATEARHYDRLRKSGIPQGPAREIASKAAYQHHKKLDKRGG